MTYKSNNNRKGNHKKKSISWEKALLPRKRKETHLKKGREGSTLSESHARCVEQN